MFDLFGSRKSQRSQIINWALQIVVELTSLSFEFLWEA